jgi:hypothetical protein
MKGLKQKIIEVYESMPQRAFIASEMAKEIGYELDEYGYFATCKNVRVAMTKLCKDGYLYQWITGNGMSPSSISNTCTYSIHYMRRDSNLAKTLLTHPNRTISGYRIR